MEKIVLEIDSQSISQYTICTTHKMKNIVIDLNTSNGYYLKCTKCLIQQKINNNQVLPIEEVQSCEDDTIFDNWPFFQDNNKVTQIFSSFIDGNKICQFFKGFRSEVIDQIDKIEQKFITQHQKLQENKKILIQYYNKVSLKKQLKETVTNLEKDFDSSIKEIEKILKTDIEKIRQNEKSNIQSIHEQFMFYYDYLSIENMNTFKLEIKKSLNFMNDIVNYKIVDILKQEESSGTFQVNQNKNYLQNDQVFQCSKPFIYSKQQLQNNSYLYRINNTYDQYLASYHKESRDISVKSLKDNKFI